MTSLTNLQYYLASRPVGAPTAEDVPYRDVPLADPGLDEAVIKNIYISLDPAIRGLIKSSLRCSKGLQYVWNARGAMHESVLDSMDQAIHF